MQPSPLSQLGSEVHVPNLQTAELADQHTTDLRPPCPEITLTPASQELSRPLEPAHANSAAWQRSARNPDGASGLETDNRQDQENDCLRSRHDLSLLERQPIVDQLDEEAGQEVMTSEHSVHQYRRILGHIAEPASEEQKLIDTSNQGKKTLAAGKQADAMQAKATPGNESSSEGAIQCAQLAPPLMDDQRQAGPGPAETSPPQEPRREPAQVRRRPKKRKAAESAAARISGEAAKGKAALTVRQSGPYGYTMQLYLKKLP